jgi:hypothetical protein
MKFKCDVSMIDAHVSMLMCTVEEISEMTLTFTIDQIQLKNKIELNKRNKININEYE